MDAERHPTKAWQQATPSPQVIILILAAAYLSLELHHHRILAE
jgi:hypothetical protein